VDRLLTASLLHKRNGFEAVKLREPPARIRNEGLQQNRTANLSNAHFISLETEFTRKTNRLAVPVEEKFGSSGF
jgi:hypothetical protein